MNVRTRLEENPFCVLELSTDCTRAEVERASGLWLAKLELGLLDAQTYDTPLGPRPRTAEAVRKAAAELRDPGRRLVHEFWALRDTSLSLPEGEPSAADHEPSAPDLLRALGWRLE